MSVQDFLERVERDPELELVYQSGTMCIVRYTGPGGPREVRLGMWAISRFPWEKLVRAFRLTADEGER